LSEHRSEHGIDRLIEVMRRLRDPLTGCPWDIEQSFASIAPYTIEEAYEVADAIERGAFDELEAELGDLLLQVVYHARMAEEQGRFDLERVAHGIADKMIRRHPHVFGEATVEDAAAQHRAWEATKAEERARKAAERGRAPSALDDVPVGLPALTRAGKLQKRAARIGLDQGATGPAIARIREEIGGLQAQIEIGTTERQLEQLGDLLFAVTNLARHLGQDAETALRRANARFERHFRAAEAGARAAEHGSSAKVFYVQPEDSDPP
jgi:ATP diphosphatase